MAIFGPKQWVNPFGKKAIFPLFKLLFFIAQKGVFSFQNIVKGIFLAYFAYKKQVETVAIFGPKQWVNPFRKMAIFRLFKLLVFKAQKGVFSFQNVLKDIFLACFASPKKVKKKWPFLDKNHRLTPLKKCQFFYFLNFLFLNPKNSSFCSKIS